MSEYKGELITLLINAYPDINDHHNIQYKNCFGAIAAYSDDTIFSTKGTFGFAIKLPPDTINKLLAEGATPLKYFPNGHVKKGYAVLPQTIIDNKALLKGYIVQSLRYVALC